MKKVIMVAFTFLIFSYSLADDVNAVCFEPTENAVINTSVIFCPGTYYLDDSDMNGAINITGEDIVVDCNNSAIVGSLSYWSFGFRVVNGKNITIKNCEIANYTMGIYLDNLNDTVIVNNTIHDIEKVSDDMGRGIWGVNLHNLTIENNTFYNIPDESAIDISSTDLVIRGNDADNRIRVVGSENVLITENNVELFYTSTMVAIQPDMGGNNITISYNTINTSQSGIWVFKNGYPMSNVYVIGNNIHSTGPSGIVIWADNTEVKFNNVIGTNGRVLYFYDSVGSTVYNNTFEGTYGFACEESSSIDLYNNTFTGDYAHWFSGSCSDVTACDNDVTYNVDSIYIPDGGQPTLVNVMRIDSTSCTPYLTATFDYDTVDFGVVSVNTNATGYGNVGVSSNLINATFEVTGTSDFTSPTNQFSITQLYFTADKDRPYPVSEIQLQLSQPVYGYYFLPYETSNLVENEWRLEVPDVEAGSYSANVTINVYAG